MTAAARNKALAIQARRVYIEALARGMAGLVAALNNATAQLLLQTAEYAVMVARRDGVQTWNRHGAAWAASFIGALRHAAVQGAGEPARPEAGSTLAGKMSLVDDDTIEREITSSRLALAMMDRATWEFSDLRTRMQVLEQHDDLAAQDLLRGHVVARLALDAWTGSGLDVAAWQMLQAELHEEFALLLGEAYHEVNRWLIAQGGMTEVDLRPFIRPTRVAAGTPPHRPPGRGQTRGGSGVPAGAGEPVRTVQGGVGT